MPEQLPTSPEVQNERSSERELEHKVERTEVHKRSESEHNREIESARAKVEHSAVEATPSGNRGPMKRHHPDAREKRTLYRQTLKHIQRELPSSASRSFSKLIHQPLVEKTSEVAAKTVFRPSLTLGASLGALLGGTTIYLVARTYGFMLPRSAWLVCAAAGAALGLLLEAVRALWRSRFKRSSA